MSKTQRANTPAIGKRAPRAVHIPALDGLRGMAILLVLLFHFGTYTARATGVRLALQNFTGAGWIGVDLFFVLSGFLITSILVEAKASDGYFKNFYMRRVLRIFPLYYGVLVFVFGMLPLAWPHLAPGLREGLSALGGPHPPRVYERIVAHQGYLWAYLQNYVQIEWAGLTHFWSLAVEEQFYLVWPAIVFLLPRRALLGVCGAMVAAALAIRLGRVVPYQHLPLEQYKAVAGATYCYTFCRMDGLAIGAFLALAAHGPGGMAKLARPAWVTGAGSGILLVALLVWLHGSFWALAPKIQTFGYTLLAVFFGSLLVAAVLAKPTSPWGRICTTRGLRFFGKYSYGLYVFHGLLVPWTGTLMTWLERHLGSYALAWLAHFVILTAIATTAALLSWHLYEKHFLKLKRFFEYRATTLREPVRDAVVPPPVEGQATVRVEPVAG